MVCGMSVRERGKGGHQRPASIGDQGAETFRVRKVTRENRCSPSPDSVFVKDGWSGGGGQQGNGGEACHRPWGGAGSTSPGNS